MTAAAKAKTGNGILDREELVDRALELSPLLREHAPKIDADRRLPDEVNTALTEAGMFRLLNPERLGQSGLPGGVATRWRHPVGRPTRRAIP